jgi:hypothetical protein
MNGDTEVGQPPRGFAAGPESAFNFARGFMGFRKPMEDGSAANTHALVELVSSCRSEYDNFGVLEVNREGILYSPTLRLRRPLMPLMGFTSPLKGSIATEGIHRHLS